MFATGLEFRVQQVREGHFIAFFPSDARGDRRDGTTWLIEENGHAGQAVKNWLPTDRVFFYYDIEASEAGYINDRTKERIRV